MKLFDTILTKFEEIVLSFSVLFMAFILIGGVISRVVFNSSWTFTEEVGTMLNVTVTFFGIGYCARMARHISMTIVYDLVGNKAKKIMTCIITLITSVVMFYVSYLAFEYMMSVLNLGRTTAALRLPYWITVVPVFLGFLLGGIEYLRTFILNVKDKENVHISSLYKLGENSEDYSEPNEEEGKDK